jgi:hypothetical protein
MRGSWRTRRAFLIAAVALLLTTVLALGVARLVRHLSYVPPWPGPPVEQGPFPPEPPVDPQWPGQTRPVPQDPGPIIVPGADEPPQEISPGPPPTDAPQLACSVQRSAPFAFRGAEARETLRVSIRGEPCGTATLRLWIEDARGNILYGYTAPFAQLVTIHPIDPALARAAAGFADDVVANAAIAGTTGQLPRWEAAQVFYGREPGAIKVPREVYDALRARDWPLLWHAIGPERWRLVVYDVELFQPRVVLEGGR